MKRWCLALFMALFVMPPQLEAAQPDEAALARADRDYEQGVRYARAGKARRAIQYFEKSLPYKNQTSDVFYNLVQACEVAKRWEKLALYGQGFLFLEPSSNDAKGIRKQLKSAYERLTRLKKPVVGYIFDVEPEGTVFVDNVPLSRNKVTEVKLSAGVHSVRAEMPGYEPWIQEIAVVEGEAKTVKAQLEKKIYKGKLAIKTNPEEGVKVFVNDEFVGATPFEKALELQTLKYLVRFEKLGYDNWSRYVTISRDETYELTPVLEKTAKRKKVVIETGP